MNKVTTVNLGGNAYQVEDTGYEALRAYLEDAGRRLANNPDRDEILADIEQGIAEKFRTALGPHKNVVTAKEVARVLEEMGPVQDDTETSAGPTGADAGKASAGEKTSAGSSTSSAGAATPGPDAGEAARRLYKIPEGAMLAGVCNGIAAYFGLDAIFVRLTALGILVVAALFSLLVHWFILLPLIAYVVLSLTLPTANSAAERAAARGDPSTAQEYIRRAKQGYYDSIRAFREQSDRERWRQMKRDLRRRYRKHHYRMNEWSPAGVPPPFPSFVLPVFGLLQFSLVVLGFCAVVALLRHDSVFGFQLPEGVPIWIGIVGVIFVIHALTWPVKAARHAYYASLSGYSHAGPCLGFFDSLVWLAVLIAGVWVCDHYIPEFHAFLLTVPEKIRQGADAVAQWWNNSVKH